MSEPRPDAFGRFVGGLMLAVGVLIALLSGACTLALGGGILSGMMRGQGSGEGLVLVLITGGVPFAGGVALMLAGWAIVRPRRKPDPEVFDNSPPPPPA